MRPSGQESADSGCGIILHLFNRALCNHRSAAGAGFRPQLNQPVRLLQHVGVVIDKNHRIPVGKQIVHHTAQALQVGGM